MTGTSLADVAALLIPVFLPFNALKAGLNSAFVLGLYKPLVGALRKVGLVQESSGGAQRSKLGMYILSMLLLITCILLLLVYKGKL